MPHTMSKLEFFTTSNIESKKLLQYIMDFEYYPNYFPAQITNVKIIKNALQTTAKNLASFLEFPFSEPIFWRPNLEVS